MFNVTGSKVRRAACVLFAVILATAAILAQESGTRTYRNTLTPIENPQPLLADYPEFVQPIVERGRFEAPILVEDEDADLTVRAWRFSYNARGIIEMPNHLQSDRTAVIVVHPWGIDDEQGLKTPEPAGVVDFCTPEKNRLAGRHTQTVIDPFLQRLRHHVALVMFSLPGQEQPVHAKLFRSIRNRPTPKERKQGRRELASILAEFDYRAGALPDTLTLSKNTPVADYFRQFPGLQSGPHYNNHGFWKLPMPISRNISMHEDDVVIYDADGYPALRDFLKEHSVRHILLTGYATDACFCSTTAGYQNLSQDFNVFLVGDATLATYPANATPKYATNAHISHASLNHLITQVSWVRFVRPAATTAQKRMTWHVAASCQSNR